MVFSTYTKQRILYLRDQGHKASVKLLSEEHVRCTRVWIAYFLERFDKAGSINRCAGSGRPLRITVEIVLCIHLIVPLVYFGGWSSCFLSPQNEPAKSLTPRLICSTCTPKEMCSIHMYVSWASICPNSGCSLLCIHLEQLIASVCVRMWLLTSACVCVHACVLHVCIVAWYVPAVCVNMWVSAYVCARFCVCLCTED